MVNSLTPLIGSVVPKWGLPRCSLLCTATILLGQTIIFLSELRADVTGMVAGLFIAGAGISPVAVVQESILLEVTKGGKSKSVAAGLLLGKFVSQSRPQPQDIKVTAIVQSSYLASVSAVPLSQSSLGPHSPFAISVLLSLLSFLAAVFFAFVYNLGRRSSSDPSDGGSENIPHGKVVSLGKTTAFGDEFWTYIALCTLSGGLWFPFIHLST